MTTIERPAAPVPPEDLFEAEGASTRSDLPVVGLPAVPEPGRLVRRLLVVAWIVLGWLALDRVATLLMDMWLMDSLGYSSVFWATFWMRLGLFALGGVLVAAAVVVPATLLRGADASPRLRWSLALLAGGLAGWVMSGTYQHFFTLLYGRAFGDTDPVFGHDLGFYVFALPAWWDLWRLLTIAALVALVSSVAAGWKAVASTGPLRRASLQRRLRAVFGTSVSRVAIGVLGALVAVGLFLARYGLVTADNYESSIPTGAEYLDVEGPLSTLGFLTAASVVTLLATIAVVIMLGGPVENGRRHGSGRRLRVVAVSLVGVLVLTFIVFPAGLSVRNMVFVQANEPVVQLPFIEQHLESTRAAWSLDAVETVDFSPNQGDDPLPDVDRLIDSPTFGNAGLWPGYVSRLERVLDPEYVDRLFLAEGDAFDEIYSTTLDAFRQQQKLRPYYDFMDVDTVRYRVDGESQLYASSVREIPLVEPQPWLAWWGQRFVLFTHGFGLVGNEIGGSDSSGRPVFASSEIPAVTTDGAFLVENERVYYGEGSGSMAYSNLEGIDELDYPTEQGRAETRLPDDVPAGVQLDSLLKRLVFGWKSGEMASIVFSDLITDTSRVHYFRTPLERLQKVAPFLYFDTDPYAVTTGERITWMANGLTTSDQYPYSAYADLGDKSDRRSPTSGDPVRVNYAADSVKATVDAYTGEVALYRISDEPVASTWAAVFPELFRSADDMPAAVADQVQYPPQLFHAQFDDLFVYYHVPDAITFFNAEDLWDDADEVVGPILTSGSAISFSMEPYPWVAETGGDLPGDGDTTFALSMAFTPESALNLRALVTAYQDGLDDDYGRLVVLQVPKGEFHISPEQADAAIDQDAFISQQIGFWNRQGNDTIRGHTTPLLVDGELVYVEPIFSRSQQNPAPQLQRVVVVMRGVPHMGLDLEDALRVALEGKRPPGLTASPDGLGVEPVVGD